MRTLFLNASALLCATALAQSPADPSATRPAVAYRSVFTGCARLSPDSDLGGVQQLTHGKTAGVAASLSANPQAIDDLLALPWRAQWQGQQHELAKLQAAQDVVRLAADTRKAWINAVAAQQSAWYLRDVKDAAEAGAELARRMARVGNWSRLEQAREQVVLAIPPRSSPAPGTRPSAPAKSSAA